MIEIPYDIKESAKRALSLAIKDERVGFAIKATIVGGAYEAFLSEVEAAIMVERERGVFLKSKDGKFLCAAEHAVEEAYLLNCAEAAIDRYPRDQWEIGNILSQYCRGDFTLEETMESINEDIPE